MVAVMAAASLSRRQMFHTQKFLSGVIHRVCERGDLLSRLLLVRFSRERETRQRCDGRDRRGGTGWLPASTRQDFPSPGGSFGSLATSRPDARRELARFGLTLGDFDMLATLRRRAVDEPIKIRDLQLSLMLSSGGTTKRLDRLEAAGLIERLPDPNDRRGTLITLSPKGLEMIDEAVPVITRYETAFVTGAIGSERNRAALENGLRQLLIAKESGGATS
ncbi:MAG: MarR family transcriptional regulator [Ilumatobacteraceae bacterium]